MNTLKIPCEPGEVSDGYHTFNELYEHRHALFLNLMKLMPSDSWFSRKHSDGSEMEGWFIAGINLKTGMVTYHLPDRLWNVAKKTGANLREIGAAWDGHTSKDVIFRLTGNLFPV